MLVKAMKAVGDAIDALLDIPEPERTERVRRMMDNLQEVHLELSVHLSRGVQGEIFPNDQLPLQEEPPERDAFEFEPVQTC